MAGPTLGLFIGGLAGITLVIPYLVLPQRNWATRAQALAAAVLGTAAVWQFASAQNGILEAECLRCLLILLAYSISLAGAALLLRAVRLPPACAAGLTVAIALAWLSWPAWMANFQHGEEHEAQVARLSIPHPIFSLNQALKRPLPDKWHESRIMYSIVSIGQHVSATLPSSIWPCILLHLIIGAVSAAGARALRL